MVRNWMFNGYRRLSAQLPYWVIPVGIGMFCGYTFGSSFDRHVRTIGYSVYAWAKQRDAWQNSKAGHLAGASH